MSRSSASRLPGGRMSGNQWQSEEGAEMWKWISWSIALIACGFPRPPAIAPEDDDGGPPGSDGGVIASLDATTCTRSTCSGALLEVCDASGHVDHTEQCVLGCFSDGARCNALAPSNGLGPSLDEAKQHDAIVLPAGSVVDTDNGAVTSAGTRIEVANAAVAQPGGTMLRAFLARSWNIDNIRIQGTLAVAFVAYDEIRVQGVIDASADANVSGPGGLSCGSDAGGGGAPQSPHFERGRTDNSGGYPAFWWTTNGFGGAGFGTAGGAGGVETTQFAAGAPGSPNGREELVPLRGGCEGGGTMPESRGAGGGAIQLVAGRAIHLIVVATSHGVLHVGGGRGIAGILGTNTNPPTGPAYGPGGGGSGGGILIEAPSVVLDDGTGLVATGGGGGGWGACTPGPDGVDAAPNATAPAGGGCPPPTQPTARGGDGATTAAGATGFNAIAGSAGSGGGGIGRIRLNTADGQYSAGTSSIVRGVTTTGTVGRR